MSRTKFVDFHEYCNKCKSKDDSEDDVNSPCFDCLDEPVNTDSKKPIYFEPAE